MNASTPSASTVAQFSAPRVTPNAAHAFGGIWRLTAQRYFTVRHWLAVAGLLAVLGLLAFGSGHPGSGTGRYVGWMAGFYICFVVPVLSFITAAGAIRDDLGAGSVDYLFTRPVWRPAFVVFRYLAHVACAQMEFLLGLAVLFGVGAFRNVPELWDAVPRLLLAQGVVVLAFSAFGMLCGMLTSRYIIVGLVYGSVVEAGVGNVPTQLSRISMVRHVREIVQPLMDGGNIGMGGPIAANPLGTPAAVAILLTVALALLAVTAAVFSVKEFSGAASREA